MSAAAGFLFHILKEKVTFVGLKKKKVYFCVCRESVCGRYIDWTQVRYLAISYVTRRADERLCSGGRAVSMNMCREVERSNRKEEEL